MAVQELEMELRVARQSAELSQSTLADKERAITKARQENSRLLESLHQTQSSEDALRVDLQTTRKQLHTAQQEVVAAAAASTAMTSTASSGVTRASPGMGSYGCCISVCCFVWCPLVYLFTTTTDA